MTASLSVLSMSPDVTDLFHVRPLSPVAQEWPESGIEMLCGVV